MGNSASNPSNGRQLHPQRRTQSPSPSPGGVHRSLRSKKRSLQLPDLDSLSLTYAASQPHRHAKTPNIPIPTTAGVDPQRERGRVAPDPFSSADLLDYTAPARGTPYYKTQQQQQVQQRRIQELYNQANIPAAPPESSKPHGSPSFVHEVVRSSIPVALQPKPKVVEGQPVIKPEPVAVKIVWRGGGHHVLLARAGDDEWKGRQVMERESPGSPVFATMVNLLPGTHHIRFLVDDQWRVADDLPTAVDDQGSLANYVAVPLTSTKPKDPSFFSESAPTSPQPPKPPHSERPNPAQQAQWTNVLPPELLEAFKEEEMYLAANQGQIDPQNHHHRVSGFVPAPNIPPAPTLPRHLDKLILNMRVSPGPALAAVGNVGTVGNAASVVQGGSSGLPSGIGSGQGGRSSRRDRTREERREERRRGRERGYSDVTSSRRMPPPPPPPSEVGEIDPALDVDQGYHAQSLASPLARGSASLGGEAGADVWSGTPTPSASEPPSTAATSAVTTPASANTPAMPSTPIAPSTPVPSSSGASGVVPSRTLAIDTMNMPPLTDDGSVLPVPSHVVLHHLCTSAIRNGVLAVGNTTRYKKKYLTTIYYKPT
ncbi:hypothetical protein EST38_g1769 [Candolleomyces aberdarensis]|uniref:Association with the SNF1 complex (ASC) domain-containing protein n=1 Tax=Candolleomyces aberdarensis TaxID=2316362 RepID=A0A4V1Q524_9AGAR|nr:hypothetical protein EST38_g1769 [Candolleomyces aberdarensis]